MAAWKDENDMTHDLDTLSGFESPSGKVKSYTTWGRAQKMEEPDIPAFPQEEKQYPEEEFEWFKERKIRKLPESVSRGKMLEILIEKCSRKGKEVEVREQIRDAIGSGYSNELIEATFKSRMECGVVKSEKFADGADVVGKQFEDAEICHLLPPGSELSENCGAIASKSTNNNFDSRKGGKPKKKRKFRNIAMESLERRNLESNSSQSNTFHGSSVNLDEISQILQKGKKNTVRPPSNIPPACYVPYKKDAQSFVYSETEFPKL